MSGCRSPSPRMSQRGEWRDHAPLSTSQIAATLAGMDGRRLEQGAAGGGEADSMNGRGAGTMVCRGHPCIGAEKRAPQLRNCGARRKVGTGRRISEGKWIETQYTCARSTFIEQRAHRPHA